MLHIVRQRANQSPTGLCQCFSTGVPRNLRVLPVVFEGSAGPLVLSKKKIKLHLTFVATRRVFQALSRSKMYLQSMLLPDTLAGAEGACCPSPRTPSHSQPSALNFGPSGLRIPPGRLSKIAAKGSAFLKRLKTLFYCIHAATVDSCKFCWWIQLLSCHGIFLLIYF